jgi:CHASE2 domain-containing sensor protein
LVLAFIVGEGFNPSGPNEWLGVLLFPVGISVGMILAWWKEGLGGSITVGSLLAFYVVHLTTAGAFPKGWAWLAFAAPGFLFLLSSHLSRRPRIGAA